MEARNYAPALISIGIDIAKDALHLAGFGADAKIAFRRKMIMVPLPLQQVSYRYVR